MISDPEPNEIENSNVLVSTENKKRYALHFNEDYTRRIRAFCESFFIDLNVFIVNAVRDYLYAIEDDIESNAFDLIGGYYDVSKLLGIQSSDTPLEVTEKKNIIEAEFPLLVSKAVQGICDEIPYTPEEFIEDIMKWSIDDIIDSIKKGRYDFLGKYKDFTEVIISIQQIYEKDRI